MRALLIIPLFLYAHTALASVVITEIAWMGDSTSADNGWIELHNTTSNSVSLDGWRLEVSKWDTQELALSIDLRPAHPHLHLTDPVQEFRWSLSLESPQH